MLVDTYTKIVLTVIAAVLSLIAFQNSGFVSEARAHSGQICEIDGATGHGELDGTEVYVYSISGDVYCP